MRYLQTGLVEYDRNRATPGYTLFSPGRQTTARLINMEGETVHEWELPSPPGNYAYLQLNGNLMAACQHKEDPTGGLSPRGGHMIEMDWDGNVLWEYEDPYQHHDFRRLPNDNLIYIAWELLSEEEAARVTGGLAGTDHEGKIWGDVLREVDRSGEIVWEWRAAGNMEIEQYPICPICHRSEFAHANTVTQTASGDVMISFRHTHTIAVIERETGLFKWEMTDMAQFGHQHDFQELPNGNYLLFANGDHTDVHGPRTGSSILEIDPDTKELVWDYKAYPRHTFFSPHISGCQRLASGNTLICEGIWGRIFEVTPEGEIVWEYVSPYFLPGGGENLRSGPNQFFRAYRYDVGGPEIRGRLDKV